MNQPATHGSQHPIWGDKWNPYTRRQYIGHRMHKAFFEMLVSSDPTGRTTHNVDYEGHGCLDAPEEIPCGSTLLIRTIGGYEREHYNRQWREVTDWKAQARNEAEVSAMLKQILKDTEA